MNDDKLAKLIASLEILKDQTYQNTAMGRQPAEEQAKIDELIDGWIVRAAEFDFIGMGHWLLQDSIVTTLLPHPHLRPYLALEAIELWMDISHGPNKDGHFLHPISAGDFIKLPPRARTSTNTDQD